jgi:hypothetical protein
MGMPSTMVYRMLNQMLGGATSIPTNTSTIWVGLMNVGSSDSTTALGTELAIGTGAYARVLTTGWTFSGRQASNTTAITFPTATADWSTAVGFAIFGSSTGSTMLFCGALDTARYALSGDTLTIPASTGIIIQVLASTDV